MRHLSQTMPSELAAWMSELGSGTATREDEMDRDYQYVLSERAGDTVTIWLNEPDRLNVLTLTMLKELTSAFSDAGESDATGVILAAKGRLFCAGHDFGQMVGQELASVRNLFRNCTTLMETMQAIPQPVIARVHALATGAGCQLVASADLAVASEEATFCTPGGKGGLFCTTPMVAVGRSVARKRALEMSMTGDPIDAHTAEAWGLVNRVVPASQLEVATSELLGRVTRGSAVAKGIGKQAFYAQIGLSQSSAYDYAVEVMAAASQIPDAQEGIAAFIEKRTPVWGLRRPS
jgi:enoyl-CoA hydratase/carnithine racemase